MQSGQNIPSSTQEIDATKSFDPDCAFCRRTELSRVLKETPNFIIAADHAPLVEGHILIIPKTHYACYGTVPASLDAELALLKQEIQKFLTRFYAPAVFWEHGIFRQTVFHAHLHCLPFGITAYDLSHAIHNAIVHSQEDIRQWYQSRGHYFYMEDLNVALLFAAEVERYMQITKEVFSKGIANRTGNVAWRTPQQRYTEGKPLIESMASRWMTFQQEGTINADGSNKR